MKVPFLDLKAQYDSIDGDIKSAIDAVLTTCAYSGGPFVERFEREFADFCGCRHAVGVCSGTDALWLSLAALGIGCGDEVITVPNTFIATAEAISRCGARPVFADIDEQRYTMDPKRLTEALTPKTRAVIPVHLFGQTADMDPILDIARARGIHVVEDACQAHGAAYKGRKAGSLGDAGCFSFYPGKNLGACGEAGAVVTNDPVLAEKIRVIRDHGQTEKYHHRMIGWNARMDGLQGAVLSVKLKHLERWNRQRQVNAEIYDELLKGIEGIVPPMRSRNSTHVYHIYAVRAGHRDDLKKALAENGISCGIHYPVPIHLTEAYQILGYGKGSFPVAERCAAELLSLPMFPEMSREQIEVVSQRIREYA